MDRPSFLSQFATERRFRENNPWMPYTEELVKTILTSEKIKLDRVALAQKLEADYVSTLAEMEAAVPGYDSYALNNQIWLLLP